MVSTPRNLDYPVARGWSNAKDSSGRQLCLQVLQLLNVTLVVFDQSGDQVRKRDPAGAFELAAAFE